MQTKYFVYILTNVTNAVLYIGVTNNLARRIVEHKQGSVEGFTKHYNVYKLVYYECHNEIKLAIEREKQLKHWTRSKKISLITSVNPEWDELKPI